MLGVVAAHQFITLYLIIAIEEAGIPLPAPGDLVIAFYGYRARDDPIELARVILTCAAASTTGTLVPYFIARRWGLPVAHRFAGWLDVDVRQVDRWIERVHRYGFRGVLLGRLIPGLRVAISLIAGTAEVPVWRFSAGVFVAAAIYWTGWVFLGALVGPQVDDLIEPYIGYIAIGIPIVFVSLFVIRLLIVRRRKR
ncbi:MAG TPA: DedA family protein [Vicinamibacterales bacterium]|nr:DedA family protein [Vicinamibacterales bacterium]